MENLWFSVSIFPQTNSLNPATKKNLCWWTVRYSHTKRLGFGLVSTHPVDWPRNEDINLGNPIHRIELWIRWKIHVLWQTQKALAHICAVTAIPWCCFVDTLKKKKRLKNVSHRVVKLGRPPTNLAWGNHVVSTPKDESWSFMIPIMSDHAK